MTGAATLTEPPATVRLHVGQGEHLITGDPEVMLTTILGSCVAMCLRDPVARIGGMNHFLLPSGRMDGADEGRRYGAYAMEVLINGVLSAGGRRDRLEAKLPRSDDGSWKIWNSLKTNRTSGFSRMIFTTSGDTSLQ